MNENLERNEKKSEELQDFAKSGLANLNALVDFRNNPVTKNTTFINRQNTIKKERVVEWTEEGFVLYSGSDYTYLYCGTWYEYSQNFLTNAERIDLYAVVKNKRGTTEIKGIDVPYHSLTDWEVEEVLAVEYRAFALDRIANEKEEDLARISKKESEGIIGIFHRVKNFFNSTKSNTSEGIDVYSNDSDKRISDVFNKLFEKRAVG